jgi:hypothetical protein
MRRITVDEVKAAYEKTGLKPKRGQYISHDKTCGCAIGALVLAEGIDASANCGAMATDYAERVFGENYRVGFVHGFDARDKDYRKRHCKFPTDEGQCEYDDGFNDGRAVAAAIFGESA